MIFPFRGRCRIPLSPLERTHKGAFFYPTEGSIKG